MGPVTVALMCSADSRVREVLRTINQFACSEMSIINIAETTPVKLLFALTYSSTNFNVLKL